LVTIRALQEDVAAQQAERQKVFANKITDSAEVMKKREERRRMKELARMNGKGKESGVAGTGTGTGTGTGAVDATGELPSLFTPETAEVAVASGSQRISPPIKDNIPVAGPSNPSEGLAYFTEVPATPIHHPWFSPETTGSLYHDLQTAREANVWNYPRTLIERARCASFRKVWEEGFYLGHGVKFGGEFLIYPGEWKVFG
jgi:hypothetical protein